MRHVRWVTAIALVMAGSVPATAQPAVSIDESIVLIDKNGKCLPASLPGRITKNGGGSVAVNWYVTNDCETSPGSAKVRVRVGDFVPDALNCDDGAGLNDPCAAGSKRVVEVEAGKPGDRITCLPETSAVGCWRYSIFLNYDMSPAIDPELELREPPFVKDKPSPSPGPTPSPSKRP